MQQQLLEENKNESKIELIKNYLKLEIENTATQF
jgi:hypothetical protein